LTISEVKQQAVRGYALGERLGAGGFGVVYRAVQPLVGRDVAIKIIRRCQCASKNCLLWLGLDFPGNNICLDLLQVGLDFG
jgi:serine/threonine protein kinase